VCGKIFEFQFSFLASSKIFIFDEVMDICVNFFSKFWKIWTSIISLEIIKLPILLFFPVLLVSFHEFLLKNLRKKIWWIFGATYKWWQNCDFCHFLQFLKSFFSNIPGCTDTYYNLKEELVVVGKIGVFWLTKTAICSSGKVVKSVVTLSTPNFINWRPQWFSW
jgi:hypothetical protein